MTAKLENAPLSIISPYQTAFAQERCITEKERLISNIIYKVYKMVNVFVGWNTENTLDSFFCIIILDKTLLKSEESYHITNGVTVV